MGQLILRRLVETVPVLVLVTLGVFLLLHLVPGDPVEAMLGESQDESAKLALRQELGLDQPLYVQYPTWAGRLLHGDLGRSVRSGAPVTEDVGRRIRPSLELAIFAMIISLAIGVPVGILSATHRDSAIDGFGTTLTLFGICMPNFLLALLLIFIFGVRLRWLPIASFVDPFDDPISGVRSLTLPAITLGLALAAVITRTLRSSLLDTLNEDYIRTARAKGLHEGAIVRAHALRNALIPVITVIGLQFGTLIGAVITVRLRPPRRRSAGGRRGVRARLSAGAGVVLLIAFRFIVSNLVVDIVWLVGPADSLRRGVSERKTLP
jgi:peptide/nickel transport system permease protein